jgi:hypothetical protein
VREQIDAHLASAAFENDSFCPIQSLSLVMLLWGINQQEKPATMEVQFEPSMQAKLEQMARDSGRSAVDLVKDAVVGYMDDLSGTREMLNSRYDDIKSGKVKMIPGDEAFARLMSKAEA